MGQFTAEIKVAAGLMSAEASEGAESCSADPAGSDAAPWYKDGLQFTCTQCGDCCTGAPGVVWVTDDELREIADYLG